MNKRKRQIIHAARRLFTEKGFNDTSIMDIISAANISKGTFYNHFISKNECLIAILEETREETVNARYEVAINTDPQDKEILIKQIALLYYVNRKRNIVEIFESLAGHSDDALKTVLERHMILEMNWLANRLIDLYGNKIRDISYECSVQAIGMMHQSFKIIAMATNEAAQPEQVTRVIINHIEAIIERQLKNKNILITPDIEKFLQTKVNIDVPSKEKLTEQLQGFSEKLCSDDPPSGVEYTNFLLNGLTNNESPYLLEAVLQAFSKAFKSTPHEAEVNEISIAFWRYLQKLDH